KDHLARYRFRHLDHGCEVELLDGCPNRGHRAGVWLLQPELREPVLELPHLAVSSPTSVAVACIPQIEAGNLFKSACRVEVGGQFVSDGLVMNETAFSGRLDGSFIKTLGVELPALKTRNFGADEGGAVREILGTILRPCIELAMVGRQCIKMLLAFAGSCRTPACGVRQGCVELIFHRLEQLRRRPPQPPRLAGRIYRRGKITAKESRLQFADPVPALGKCKCLIAGQVSLEPKLVELFVVKRAECPRQPPQHPDQSKLRSHQVDGQPEPCPLGESQAVLRFILCFCKRMAGREQVHVEAGTTEGGVCNVANAVCGVECEAKRVTRVPQMLVPRHDEVA